MVIISWLPALALSAAVPQVSIDELHVMPAGKLVVPQGQFRDRVGVAATSLDGVVVVGAPSESRTGTNAGAVYVFESPPGGRFGMRQRIASPDLQEWRLFGRALALTSDTLFVGAPGNSGGGRHQLYKGSVFVHERDAAGRWTFVQELLASDGRRRDEFGFAMAVDGETLVVGAHYQTIPTRIGGLGQSAGAAYVFVRLPDGTWVEEAKLLPFPGREDENFGTSVAIEGNRIAVGAPAITDNDQGGAVYVFERGRDGAWHLSASLRRRVGHYRDAFGFTVSLQGSLIVAGSQTTERHPLRSVVHTFQRDPFGAWVEGRSFMPEDTIGFGRVAMKDDVLAVAGPGVSHFYSWSGSRGWRHEATAGPDDPTAYFNDAYGLMLSNDGEQVVVGANLDDDVAEDAGAVYVYSLRRRR